jgi:hypothetical protein
MEDDDQPQATTPDSLLPYDVWMEEAMRHVVVRALGYVAANGLPGEHHYFLTFRTDFPGVAIPKRVLEKYPDEMTIVLQHQFRDLYVDETARVIGVTLSFGGVAAPLTIPLDAVSAFVDPHVKYGLRFRVRKPEVLAPPPVPAPAPAEVPAASETPQIVSLDAFRKRRD